MTTLADKPSHPVFSCRQCGECCAGRGGILVTPQEVEALAAFLEVSPREFSSRYLETSPLGPQIAVADARCVFLEAGRCRVHPVKPRICREWPFLPALLKDPEEFAQAKGACPGLDPEGSHLDFVKAAENKGS